MPAPNINLKDVVEQAQDTLASIRAVKGEKYADSVQAALNAASVTTCISGALAGKFPPELGNVMLLMFVSEFVSRVCEMNGTPFDDEMQGWVDRIKTNTDSAVNAMQKAARPGDEPLQ
jgi:hypothetical protein